jgi:hypothetical protein
MSTNTDTQNTQNTQNTQRENEKTLEEVIGFWQEQHENISFEDRCNWSEDAKGALVCANLLGKNNLVYKMFMLSETNYNIDKANELMKSLDRPSKVAEYIHLKFYDNENAFQDFQMFVVGSLSQIKDLEGILEQVMDDLPDELKGSFLEMIR